MLAKVASVSARTIKKPSPFRVILTVSPAVNGITQWDLLGNGDLVLDGGTATSYTITTSGVNPGNILMKAWGQGTCQATGGYSTGNLSLSSAINLAVRLNAGAGSGGTQYGSGASPNGGGYAGVFNSTVSQANAFLIAGGAGGSGSNTGGCNSSGGSGGGSSGSSGTSASNSQIQSTGGGSGSQSSAGSGGYALETVYTTGTVQKDGGFYHVRASGVDTTANSQGPWTSTPTQGSTTSQPSDGYTYTFTTPYNDSSYSISASNTSGDQNYSANGTYYPGGFYYTISNKSSTGFKINWYLNADNSAVFVRYHSISCSGQGTTTSTNDISASGGSALSGGTGGRGSIGNGGGNASSGGGGGGGYYGGGGGGGGNDYNSTTRDSSGGGGGSGYVSGSLTSASTSSFANGSDPNRGNAGSASGLNNSYYNSRIVIQYSP
jgi:hypothetical protein